MALSVFPHFFQESMTATLSLEKERHIDQKSGEFALMHGEALFRHDRHRHTQGFPLVQNSIMLIREIRKHQKSSLLFSTKENPMKKSLIAVLAVLLLLTLSACLAPRASSPEDKRAVINSMHDETLARLYEQNPASREIISKAAGYAVFSNVHALYLFLGGGGGYGVAVDQSSGQRTYMKMAQVDVGLGLGVQDIRVVFVFHSDRAYMNFVNIGWEFGGQADAAAKAPNKGVAATGAVSINAETTMYTMSEAGLMAKVNLAGTKFWRDESLNIY